MADHKCVSGGVVWPRLMLFRRGGRANGVLRVASPVCCLLLELQHGGTELLNSYAASGLTTNVSQSPSESLRVVLCSNGSREADVAAVVSLAPLKHESCPLHR